MQPTVGIGRAYGAVDAIVGQRAVAALLLVQNCEIHAHAMPAPPGMRAQDLMQQGRALGFAHTHAQDRQVARDTVAPERLASTLVATQDVGSIRTAVSWQ
jgi:hypothetical protein